MDTVIKLLVVIGFLFYGGGGFTAYLGVITTCVHDRYFVFVLF